MTGRLAEVSHGAGIWISPVNAPGLELMVPWLFVKSVVTAETPEPSKIFGLMGDLAQPKGPTKSSTRSRGRNNVK
jgi:hypothetical protein